MTRPFATGKSSKALCDRCGWKIDYVDLRQQIINEKPSGLLVCDSCLDLDHPQLRLGKVRIDDPQALRNPRSNSAEHAVADTPVEPLDFPFFPDGANFGEQS